MTRYLLVRAASFHLLIDANLVAAVGDAAVPGEVDVSRALDGGPASVFVTLGGSARVRQVGVDAVRGLIDLAEADLAPLPALCAAAVGEDIDAVTLERFSPDRKRAIGPSISSWPGVSGRPVAARAGIGGSDNPPIKSGQGHDDEGWPWAGSSQSKSAPDAHDCVHAFRLRLDRSSVTTTA
jgi:hypothetical protein